MEPGVEVWLREKNGPWIEGIILEKNKVEAGVYNVIVQHKQHYKYFQIEEGESDPPDLKLRNAHDSDDLDDLTGLQHLNEPAILYSLVKRYQNDVIYTFTGPILIALNPFKDMKNLYSTQNLAQYLKYESLNSYENVLKPHAYSIAGSAYGNMMAAIGAYGDKTRKKSQSILISGESGAGKTESTKIVLGYLTKVSSGNQAASEKSSIMNKILSTNPILESLGNAKTNRNHNSSRFGKFIEMNFDGRGRLVGGVISTYLLEKVRLPNLQHGERNYHIFYQMVAGATDEELKEWGLDRNAIQTILYTSQGGIVETPELNDAEDFKILREAFLSMEISKETQNFLFNILAGILHIGQLTFVPTNSDNVDGSKLSTDPKNQEHLNHVCRLWCVQSIDIERTLTITFMPAVRNETIQKKLSPFQAACSRDSLVKTVYARLFDWIVDEINRTIDIDPDKVDAHIGVLDIFGFEIFAQNSFEQLCINYANEALQQQFNEFVFRAEQQEYLREEISWHFIQFPDSKDRLDLIDGKPIGILAIIDDFCLLPKPTDEKLANALGDKLKNSNLFSMLTQSRKSGAAVLPPLPFQIQHFAGEVVYSMTGFVEKNREELPKQTYDLLQSSTSFLKHLFKNIQPPTKFQSVGIQFKEQLRGLMRKIDNTAPHYIRCLKPNDACVPNQFEHDRVTQQLRYCGVLEVCRVSRSGFHVRYKHTDFLSRYLNLVTLEINKYIEIKVRNAEYISAVSSPTNFEHKTSPNAKLQELQTLCSEMIHRALPDDLVAKTVQIGKTKVFLRKKAHDILEKMLSLRLRSTLSLQANFRGYLVRKSYRNMKSTVVIVQKIIRGFLGKVRARKIAFERRREARICEITNLYNARRIQRWYRAAIIERLRLFRIEEFTEFFNTRRIQRWYRKVLIEWRRKQRIDSITKINTARRIQKWYRVTILNIRRKKRILELTLNNSTRRIQQWFRNTMLAYRRKERIKEITLHNNAIRIQRWSQLIIMKSSKARKLAQKIFELTQQNQATRLQIWYTYQRARQERDAAIREKIKFLTSLSNIKRIQRWWVWILKRRNFQARRIQRWYRKIQAAYMAMQVEIQRAKVELENYVEKLCSVITISKQQLEIAENLVLHINDKYPEVLPKGDAMSELPEALQKVIIIENFLKNINAKEWIPPKKESKNKKSIQPPVSNLQDFVTSEKVAISEATVINDQPLMPIDLKAQDVDESERTLIEDITESEPQVAFTQETILEDPIQEASLIETITEFNSSEVEKLILVETESIKPTPEDIVEVDEQIPEIVSTEPLYISEPASPRISDLSDHSHLKDILVQKDQQGEANIVSELDTVLEMDSINMVVPPILAVSPEIITQTESTEVIETEVDESIVNEADVELTLQVDLVNIPDENSEPMILTLDVAKISDIVTEPIVEKPVEDTLVVTSSEEIVSTLDNVNGTEGVNFISNIKDLELVSDISPTYIEKVVAGPEIVNDDIVPVLNNDSTSVPNGIGFQATSINIAEDVIELVEPTVLDKFIITESHETDTVVSSNVHKVVPSYSSFSGSEGISFQATSYDLIEEETNVVIEDMHRPSYHDLNGLITNKETVKEYVVGDTPNPEPFNLVSSQLFSEEVCEECYEETVTTLSDAKKIEIPTPSSEQHHLPVKIEVIPEENNVIDNPAQSITQPQTPANGKPLSYRRASFQAHSVDENVVRGTIKRGDSSAVDFSPLQYFRSKLQKLYAAQSFLPKVVDHSSIPDTKIGEFMIELRSLQDGIRDSSLYPGVMQDEMHVNLEEIFGRNSGSHPQKALLIGERGSGKSTILSTLTYHWGKGEHYQDLDFVFKLSFPLLTGEIWQSSYSSEDMMDPLSCFVHFSLTQTVAEARQRPLTHYGASIAIDKEEIKEVLRECRGTTLLLLDGYCDTAYLPNFQPSQSNESATSQSYYHKLLSQIWDVGYVLGTSRPCYLSTPAMMKFEQIVWLRGFADLTVEKYINKYFPPPSHIGDRLLEATRLSVSLRKTLRCPLYLSTTCLVCAENPSFIDKWISTMENEASAKISTESVYFYPQNTSKLFSELLAWLSWRFIKVSGLSSSSLPGSSDIIDLPIVQAILEVSLYTHLEGRLTASMDDIEFAAKKFKVFPKSILDFGCFRPIYLPINVASSPSNAASDTNLGKFSGVGEVYYCHASFLDYLASLALYSLLQNGNPARRKSAVMYIARNRQSPRVLPTLRYIAHHISIQSDLSQQIDTPSDLRNEAALAFWDSLLCSVDNVTDLDINSRVMMLLQLTASTGRQLPSYLPSYLSAMVDIVVLLNLPQFGNIITQIGYSTPQILEGMRAALQCDASWKVSVLANIYDDNMDDVVRDLCRDGLIKLIQSSEVHQDIKEFISLTLHERPHGYKTNPSFLHVHDPSKTSNLPVDVPVYLHANQKSMLHMIDDDTANQPLIESYHFRSDFIASMKAYVYSYLPLSIISPTEMISYLITSLPTQHPGSWDLSRYIIDAMAHILQNYSDFILDLSVYEQIVNTFQYYLPTDTPNKTKSTPYYTGVTNIFNRLSIHARTDESSIVSRRVFEAYVLQLSLSMRSSIDIPITDEKYLPSHCRQSSQDIILPTYVIETIQLLQQPCWILRWQATHYIIRIIKSYPHLLEIAAPSELHSFKPVFFNESYKNGKTSHHVMEDYDSFSPPNISVFLPGNQYARLSCVCVSWLLELFVTDEIVHVRYAAASALVALVELFPHYENAVLPTLRNLPDSHSNTKKYVANLLSKTLTIDTNSSPSPVQILPQTQTFQSLLSLAQLSIYEEDFKDTWQNLSTQPISMNNIPSLTFIAINSDELAPSILSYLMNAIPSLSEAEIETLLFITNGLFSIAFAYPCKYGSSIMEVLKDKLTFPRVREEVNNLLTTAQAATSDDILNVMSEWFDIVTQIPPSNKLPPGAGCLAIAMVAMNPVIADEDIYLIEGLLDYQETSPELSINPDIVVCAMTWMANIAQSQSLSNLSEIIDIISDHLQSQSSSIIKLSVTISAIESLGRIALSNPTSLQKIIDILISSYQSFDRPLSHTDASNDESSINATNSVLSSSDCIVKTMIFATLSHIGRSNHSSLPTSFIDAQALFLEPSSLYLPSDVSPIDVALVPSRDTTIGNILDMFITSSELSSSLMSSNVPTLLISVFPNLKPETQLIVVEIICNLILAACVDYYGNDDDDFVDDIPDDIQQSQPVVTNMVELLRASLKANAWSVRRAAAICFAEIVQKFPNLMNSKIKDDLLYLLTAIPDDPSEKMCSIEAAEALCACVSMLSSLPGDLRFDLANEFYEKVQEMVNSKVSLIGGYKDSMVLISTSNSDFYLPIIRKLSALIMELLSSDQRTLDYVPSILTCYCSVVVTQPELAESNHLDILLKFFGYPDEGVINAAYQALTSLPTENSVYLTSAIMKRLHELATSYELGSEISDDVVLKKYTKYLSEIPIEQPSFQALNHASGTYFGYGGDQNVVVSNSEKKEPLPFASPVQVTSLPGSLSSVPIVNRLATYLSDEKYDEKEPVIDGEGDPKKLVVQILQTISSVHTDLNTVPQHIRQILSVYPEDSSTPRQLSNDLSTEPSPEKANQVEQPVIITNQSIIIPSNTNSESHNIRIVTDLPPVLPTPTKLTRSGSIRLTASASPAVVRSKSIYLPNGSALNSLLDTSLSTPSQSMSLPSTPSIKSGVEARTALCTELGSSRVTIVQRAVKALVDQPSLVELYDLSRNLESSLKSSPDIKTLVLDVYVSLAHIKAESCISTEVITKLASFLGRDPQRDDVKLKVLKTLIEIINYLPGIITRPVIEGFVFALEDKYPKVRLTGLQGIACINKKRPDLLLEVVAIQKQNQHEEISYIPSSIPTSQSTNAPTSSRAESMDNRQEILKSVQIGITETGLSDVPHVQLLDYLTTLHALAGPTFHHFKLSTNTPSNQPSDNSVNSPAVRQAALVTIAKVITLRTDINVDFMRKSLAIFVESLSDSSLDTPTKSRTLKASLHVSYQHKALGADISQHVLENHFPLKAENTAHQYNRAEDNARMIESLLVGLVANSCASNEISPNSVAFTIISRLVTILESVSLPMILRERSSYAILSILNTTPNIMLLFPLALETINRSFISLLNDDKKLLSPLTSTIGVIYYELARSFNISTIPLLHHPNKNFREYVIKAFKSVSMMYLHPSAELSMYHDLKKLSLTSILHVIGYLNNSTCDMIGLVILAQRLISRKLSTEDSLSLSIDRDYFSTEFDILQEACYVTKHVSKAVCLRALYQGRIDDIELDSLLYGVANGLKLSWTSPAIRDSSHNNSKVILLCDGIEYNMNLPKNQQRKLFKASMSPASDVCVRQYLIFQPIFVNIHAYLDISAADYPIITSVVAGTPIVPKKGQVSFLRYSNDLQNIPTYGCILVEYRDKFGYHVVTKIGIVYSLNNPKGLISEVEDIVAHPTHLDKDYISAQPSYRQQIFGTMDSSKGNIARYYGQSYEVDLTIVDKIIDLVDSINPSTEFIASAGLRAYFENVFGACVVEEWPKCLDMSSSDPWTVYSKIDLLSLTEAEKATVIKEEENIVKKRLAR